MQSFPNGLPAEDARAVVLNVAYGLAETHRDGVIHRRVCPSTVLVPDAPCCDTARSARAPPICRFGGFIKGRVMYRLAWCHKALEHFSAWKSSSAQ